MTVDSNTTRQIFACNGVTTARTADFRVIDASQLRVVRYTIATGATVDLTGSGTDYTVTSAGGATTDFSTTVAYSSAYKIIALLDVSLSQETDYVANDSFPAESHETALDKLTLIAQQQADVLSRCATLPEFAATNLTVVLPTPTDGYGLVWDGVSGTIRNTTVSMATLETEAAALYAIAADITTVASISANVTSVAGNAANINTVAGIAAAVSTVGSISGAVSAVSANSANINTVAGISANITTVAGISANVTTVAGISASVTTVAGLSTQITGVYNIRTDVTTVAGISGNVTTVAGISANVTSVAGNATNINAAVANATNINAVVANATNINTVAGIAANITTVAGISANVTTVAGITANLATVAGISADVTTVAGVSTAVSTVSTNIAAVNTCATNIAAILDAPAQAAAAAASAAAASAAAAGISMKSSCRVATTAALTVTYANGALGVGATLTNAGVQAAISLDSVALSVNDRVLVKDQASALQNGIYIVTVVGTGATNWVLTRATDYDQAAEIVEGTASIIEEGTTNSSHIYVMTHNGAITVGTTAIDWTSLTANATSANTLTTPRAIYGNNFDGSAALTQIIASTYGGTGNGFTKFSGATTSERTYTLPDASCTILTSNALVTSAQGGTGNGFTKFSGPTTSERTKTLRDASDTILELGGSYTPSGTWTSMTFVTPALGTPASGVLSNCTTATQSSGDNSTKLASTAYADAAAKRPFRTTSAASTLIASDSGGVVELTGSTDRTFDATAVATLGVNWSTEVWNNSSAVLTFDPNAAEQIDALTSIKMYPGEHRRISVNAAGTAFVSGVIKGFRLQVDVAASPFTFTLPPGYLSLDVGGWGGGASGAVRTTTGGAAGGGGGAYNVATIPTASIGAAGTTVTITIGAGGAAVATSNANGNNGGNSTFGSIFTVYGGGAGKNAAASPCLGGGGGGQESAGSTLTSTAVNAVASMLSGAGAPLEGSWVPMQASGVYVSTSGNFGYMTPGYIAASAGPLAVTTQSFDGGGMGGLGGTPTIGMAVNQFVGIANGEPSYNGGGGGGGGLTPTIGGNSVNGGAGGGGCSSTAGGTRTGGTSTNGGNGGAGGANTGGNGTSGSTPGGGGGGAVQGGNSGAGGDGRIIVIGIV